MFSRRGMPRLARAALWLVPGVMTLGTSSCAKDLRDGLVDAGVAFISDTAGEVLDALFPVDEWLAGPSSGEPA